MSPSNMKLSRLFITALMLMAAVMLLPAITSEGSANISTMKQVYAPGEQIDIAISGLGESVATVYVADPNNAQTYLGGCLNECIFIHSPAVIVEGTHMIRAFEEGNLIAEKAIMVSGTQEHAGEADSAEGEGAESSGQAALEAENGTGEPAYLDNMELLDRTAQEAELGNATEEKGIASLDDIMIAAQRSGNAAKVYIRDRSSEAADSLTFGVKDGLGRLYVLNAESTAIQGIFQAEIPLKGINVTVEYRGISRRFDLEGLPEEARRLVEDAPLYIEAKNGSSHSLEVHAGLFTEDGEDADTGLHGADWLEERYGLELNISSSKVKRIKIRNLTIKEGENSVIRIEEVNASFLQGGVEGYAIDPTRLNFTEAEVSAVASDDARLLMKCTDYIYSERLCIGEWSRVMELAPGMEYSFTLTPEDPLFAEFPYTRITDDCTVVSNRANTNYNLDILAVRDRTNRIYRSYMKWDITGLPDNIRILNAVLNMYLSQNGGTNSVRVHHVYDDTWDSQSESTMTWNNQVCGTGFTDSADCNLTYEDSAATTSVGWIALNITGMITSEYESSGEELSLALKSPETSSLTEDRYYSSESTSSNRPWINVTYSYYPSVELAIPGNSSTSYYKAIDFNFSVWDDSDYLNCTLWANFSGAWEANRTLINVPNGTTANFTVSAGMSEGAYIWNVICNDTDGLSSMAAVNYTVIISKPSIMPNQSSYLTVNSVRIAGTGYPPSSNITFWIKDNSSEYVAGYPKTIMSSSNGAFNQTWTIPVSADSGAYSAYAYLTSDEKAYDETQFTVYGLELHNVKTDYTRGEFLNFTAGSFSPEADVRISIIDPYLDPVSGYPKVVKSNSSGEINDSWLILETQPLGQYILNTNEVGIPSRSMQAEFEVVTAVIYTEQDEYEQGLAIPILGYSWDANENVTINITSPEGEGLLLINVTSNSTGEVNYTYSTDYNYSVGAYALSAFEPSNPSKQDSHMFNVTARAAEVHSDYGWYKRLDSANLSGSGFSPGGEVELSIFNSTHTLPGYPVNMTANSTGGLNTIWDISAGTNTGNYTVSMHDKPYPNLNGSAALEIRMQNAQTDKTAYKSGQNVLISGTSWDRNSEVTIGITNSTGHSASGYPKDAAVGGSGLFEDSWTSQPGNSFGAEPYTIFVRQKNDASENKTIMINVTLSATLATDRQVYYPFEYVNITGSFYSALSNVEILVEDSSGANALGYPKIIVSDSTGSINHSWYTGAYCPGQMEVKAEDTSFPGLLNASAGFKIMHRNSTSKDCYTQWGFDCAAGPPESSSNTFDTCPTGTGNDESVEELTVNASVAAAGDSVSVTCTMDPYTSGDYINIWYYNSTGWRRLYNEGPMGSSSNVVRQVNFTVDNATGTHWVRCMIDYDQDTQDECADSGSWYDNDDINFIVVQRVSDCTEFDAAPPDVVNLTPQNGTVKIGHSLELWANVSDSSGVSNVMANVSYPNMSSTLHHMTDYDGDGAYNFTFRSAYDAGMHMYSIIANDTWSNINSSESSAFYVEYDTLEISTDKQSYLNSETAYIYGSGFSAGVPVEITISNSSGQAMQGYPKNVSSNSTGGINDSWGIGAEENLGEYTAYGIDVSNSARNASSLFNIVTAVISCDKTGYEQGETVMISGYSWDANENVTINITGPEGLLEFGPANITSNSSGHVNMSWHLAYDAGLGNYTVSAIQPSNPNKTNAYQFASSKRKTKISGQYSWHKKGQTAYFSGERFSPSENVTVEIYNSSGDAVPGYPANVSSNSSSQINFTWHIPEDQALGTYYVNCTDSHYPNLFNFTSLEVAVQNVSVDKILYKSGENVIIEGWYWDRSQNTTLFLYNSSGHTAGGFPKNITASADGYFISSWTAQPGQGFGREQYNLTATQEGDASENSTARFNVTRSSTLFTDKAEYLGFETVRINGSFYSASQPVTLWIRSLENSGNAKGYPVTLYSDSSGAINHTWNTMNYCPGSYATSSEDTLFPDELNAEAEFTVLHKNKTTTTCDSVWGFDCAAGPPESSSNTFDTCPTGTGNDESVEELTVNATIAYAGDTILVTCTMDPYTSGDYINIWYYNSTGWRRLYNEGPMGSSSNVVREVAFTADNITGTHWVRCMIDYDQDTQDECADSGSWYDNDDVSFRVMMPVSQCTEFDTAPPSVLISSPVAGDFNLTEKVNITAAVSDISGVSNVYAYIEYPNSSVHAFEMKDQEDDGSYNLTFGETLITGTYTITISANDTWNNFNSTETAVFNVYDRRSPSWSDYRSSHPSPSEYNYLKAYQFNITWTDNYRMGMVWVEHNFTGEYGNYTISSNSSGEYYYDMASLPAGTYSLRFYANDTSGNMNSSGAFSYTVSRNSSAISLLLNSQNSSMTIEVYEAANITASVIEGEKPVTIYINSVVSGAGYPGAENISVYSSIGAYNITASYMQSQNYSASSKSLWLYANDTRPPVISNITPENQTFAGYNDTVYFNASVSDEYQVQEVWIRLWNRILEIIRSMFQAEPGLWQANITLNKSFVGELNYTIYANDTSGNINLTDNYSIFVLDELRAETDRQSYIWLETVYINGTGFNITSSASLEIFNSTDMIPGYPKTIATDSLGRANASWTIPSGQQLGEYSARLNSTTSERSATASFDIVTAIAQTNQDEYTQGMSGNISGYNWNPGENVTVNITDPSGKTVFGPRELTSNSSGGINASLSIGYNYSTGTYKLYAEQASASKYDYHLFSVAEREVQISTEVDWYKEGDSINTTGYGFSPDVDVTINIFNSTASLGSYPYNITSSQSGEINDSWTVGSSAAEGGYSISAYDFIYRNLNHTIQIRIAEASAWPDRIIYNNGDYAHISGSYWDRLMNVTISITNSTGHAAPGYPKSIAADSDGNISDVWIANVPGIDDMKYNVTVADELEPSENISFEITVKVAATLDTDREDYDQFENATITGSYYTALDNVTLRIFNSDNKASAYGFPAEVAANSSREIIYAWNTSDYCEGNYTARAIDVSYPAILNAEKNFTIEYYDINLSIQAPSGYHLSGNYGGSGGTLADAQASDNYWLYFGGVDTDGRVNAWINFTYDLSAGNITPDRIIEINITAEYCHSGNQVDPVCNSGPVHEGNQSGSQLAEAYNFTAGEWVGIGELAVNHATANENTAVFSITSGFEDIVQEGALHIRYEVDFNETGSQDDLLLIDYSGAKVYYKTDVARNCTKLMDIMGNASSITAHPSSSLEVRVNGAAADYSADYEGMANISVFNGTAEILEFMHNFSDSPLYLDSMAVIYFNKSIGAGIPEHENILLYVPLVDEQCNTLVCDEAINRSGCGISNVTLYPEPVNGYCLISANGTWAEDAPDRTDFEVLDSGIKAPKRVINENENISINATVYNRGNTKVRNLTVEFYDVTHTKRIYITNITLMNPNSETEITDVPWSAKIGMTRIDVRADPFNKYGEYDESNNNGTKFINVSSWQFFYGDIMGNLTIGSGNYNAFEWLTEEHIGNLYVAGAGIEIDWTRLQALGRNASGGKSNQDFAEADWVMNMSGANESIIEYFGLDNSTPKETVTLKTVEFNDVPNVPVANTTNSTGFRTGILWDMSGDSNGEFDLADREELVFVTRINESTQGRWGVYDYEIRVPAYLREYGSASGYVDIYVSLD